MGFWIRWLPTFLLVFPVFAQDTCEIGTARAHLDAGDVDALIPNNGMLFWDNDSQESSFEVPKGKGVHALFDASVWIGGKVDGELRLAATRYGPAQLWPGPVGAASEECETYDRIYEVRAEDLDVWNATGMATRDMRDWPWQLGAPVTDGDGNPDNYNLSAGDHPELRGEQTLWWIMNDAGGEHHWPDTASLEIEVAATAFASNLSPLVSQTTFYRYEWTYRGTPPLKQAYLSLFVDPDLGAAFDDYVGSDTTLGMGYVYNKDNDDDDEYGKAPPAVGMVVLDAPILWREVQTETGAIDPVKSNYMTSFMYFVNGGGSTQGDPNTSSEYYNFMQGRWGTGEPMTVGGYGLGFSNEVTTFAFPAEPDEYWSEGNNESICSGCNYPADRRMMLSNGPFTLEPDESTTFYFAIVWSWGSSNLDSVRQLKKDAAIVKQVAPTLLKPIYEYKPDIPPEPDYPLGANGIYPNPASDTATLDYSLPHPMNVRLEVFDVLGRRVFDGFDGMREAGVYTAHVDVTDWPAGVYTARLQLDQIITTKKFAVVR